MAHSFFNRSQSKSKHARSLDCRSPCSQRLVARMGSCCSQLPAATIKASSSSHTSQRSGNQDGAAATKHINLARNGEFTTNFEGDLSIPQEIIDE